MSIKLKAGAVVITEHWGAPIWGFVIVLFLFPTAAVPVYEGVLWSRDAPQLVAYSALLAVALIWSCWRLSRMGVRFDDSGVTVRNIWRTYQLGWNEVSHFADGGNEKGAWALRIVCRDGQAVTAQGTLSLVKPEVLTAIGQVAERYLVRTEITGRSPAMQAAAGSSDLPSQTTGS